MSRWRGNRRYARGRLGGGLTELAALELYLAQNLFSWMRADYRSEASGNVTAFFDKVMTVAQGATAPNARSVDPNHAFAQTTAANQVAAITPSVILGGREAAAFTSIQYYQSTIGITDWPFLHDGTGMQVVPVWASTDTAASTLWWTIQGTQTGAHQYTSGGGLVTQIFNGATATINAVAGSTPTNTGVYNSVQFATSQNPDAIVTMGSSTPVFSGDVTAGVSSGSASNTLGIGARANGSVNSTALISDLMFAKYTSAALLTAQRRYVYLRYGLS